MAAVTWKDYFGSFVLSIDNGTAGAEVYTVLPAAAVSVNAKPFIRGKKAVVELIDGTRKVATSEGKWHIDIEIKWEEMGRTKALALVTWITTAFPLINSNEFKFYPNANTAGTAPDGVNAGVIVIPEFTEKLIQMVYDDRIRNREATLILKSTTAVTTANLPSWINT